LFVENGQVGGGYVAEEDDRRVSITASEDKKSKIRSIVEEKGEPE
jgi:hypothetical protein